MNSSDEIFYIRSNNVLLEERISHFLLEYGIKPRVFGGCSLLDYTEENVPWKDIIMAHSWRSPLIPFVDFVLDRLRESNPQKPIEIPLAKLLHLIGEPNSHSFQNEVNIDTLLQSLGKSSGGTIWGKSIVKSFSKNNEDEAMAELKSFLHTLQPKNEEEKQTHFTSRLSPFLARGILSSRQVYHQIINQDNEHDTSSFVRRLCWRDYTHAVVSLFPDVLFGRPIRLGYKVTNDELTKEKNNVLNRWKKGLVQSMDAFFH